LAGDLKEQGNGVLMGGDVADTKALEEVAVLAEIGTEAPAEAAEGVLRPEDVSRVDVRTVL
jgi:hypothetical protein